jgi:hypothetical protein
MKPKTTLNLLKYFFPNFIQKTTSLLSFFIDKKVRLIPLKFSPLPILAFNSSLNFAKSVFNITTSKTDKFKNIKIATPQEKNIMQSKLQFFGY